MDNQSFSTQRYSTVQEAHTFSIVPGDLSAMADLCGATPFDDLLSKETKQELAGHLTDEERSIRIEAITALMSFIFRPVNNRVPGPMEVAMRNFTLVYSLRPELIDGMSLAEIGELFGDKSRQMISKRVIKNDATFGLHARNRKSSSAVEVYAKGTKEWHAARIAEERRIKKLEAARRYKEEFRGLIQIANREYYEKNKARIVAAQKKRYLAKKDEILAKQRKSKRLARLKKKKA